MTEVKYGLLLKKSWNDLRNNLVVFLPILMGILFTIGLAIIFALEFGLIYFLGWNIKTNIVGFISLVVLFCIIDCFLIIWIISMLKAMGVGLFKVAITTKKATTQDMWDGMRNYTGLYFRVILLLFLVYLLPVLLLGLLTLLGLLIGKTVGIIFGVVFGFILVIYFIALMLLLVFGLFFIEPISTTIKDRNATNLIRTSFKYTKENFGHVMLTWVITFGIGIITNILYQIVSMPMRFFPILFFFLIVPMLVIGIITIIINVWLKLFIFNSYFNYKIKKL